MKSAIEGVEVNANMTEKKNEKQSKAVMKLKLIKSKTLKRQEIPRTTEALSQKILNPLFLI